MDLSRLEEQLCDGYAEEKAIYTQALGIAQAMRQAEAQGDAAPVGLTDLVQILENANRVEARLAPLKDAWRQAGRRPQGNLVQLLGEVARLIQEVQHIVDQSLQATQQQQQQLAPEVDALIRRQNMRRAYGAAKK